MIRQKYKRALTARDNDDQVMITFNLTWTYDIRAKIHTPQQVHHDKHIHDFVITKSSRERLLTLTGMFE
jgi:hypothetical protein